MRKIALALVALFCAAMLEPDFQASAADASPTVRFEQSHMRCSRLTEMQALRLIENRPETQRFFAEAAKQHLKPHVDFVDAAAARTGSVSKYLLHVYVIVMDNNQVGHTATLNWYEVDCAGGVIEEF